ncbi:MAG: YkgJ family cysteine cluster protein [Cyclobacteriaceae bacterium]
MSLSQKVQEIEEVFALLDQEMSKFQGWSGLTCKTGCGRCCKKADIEATVLEFLPFAHHVYLQNQSWEWLGKLKEHPDAICLLFESGHAGAGSCSQYLYRGLICRLFGFSARTNKYAQREFVTCQVIRTEQAEAYDHTVKTIQTGGEVPVMNQYYMRLHSIDPDLARDFYPINEAIKRAIETVLHYYAYRN